jgi:hypothetical protein
MRAVALEITTSIPPYRRVTSSATRATASASVTSSRRPSTRAVAPGRLGDPGLVAAGEQDEVLRTPPGGESFDECVTDALVGSGDKSDALGCHDARI